MKFSIKGVYAGLLWVLMAAPVLLSTPVHAARISSEIMADFQAAPPLNAEDVPPLVMLVMSRDEQLYVKAYTDYTDLDGNGTIDATYDDSFKYAGYFGSSLCYTYGSGEFAVSATGTGSNGHSCSGNWSGNFLNWLTMSRLDIVRSVLYGGKRSTDTATKTVLQRAAIPNDLHAWVKVYEGTDAEVASFTPYSAGPISFCNASFYGTDGRPNASGPQLRVASGNWSEWAATQGSQCDWGDGSGDQPSSTGSSALTVRVEVCSDADLLEGFCRQYEDSAAGTENWKPAGLLQQYGEEGKLRFGLMTGSYGDPRSGGRLRSNIRRFAGNSSDPTTCVTGDEVKLSDGTFCNQGAGVAGIVNTLDRLMLVGWHSSNDRWTGASGTVDDCYEWGGRSRPDQDGNWVLDNPGGGENHCSAYGNPLSEIYAEALRYIEGETTPTTAFTDGGADNNFLPGIPDGVAWLDPYRAVADGGNPYCADCSILVLSTGLNSFDSDEIPVDSAAAGAIDAKAATTAVGVAEEISGDYLVGRVLGQGGSPATLTLGAAIDTPSDVCTAKNVDALGNVIGICPDVPSLEGSYYIAGLAHKAATTSLRTLVPPSASSTTRALHVQTYTVQLAESLPSFSIPTGSGEVQFSPACQSNRSGYTIGTDNNWEGDLDWSTCALGDVRVGEQQASVGSNYTYGRPVLSDATAGSYTFVWEDSTYGSDHDLDATEIVTWCVGDACDYQSPQTIAGTRLNIDGTVFNGYDICWRSDSPVCVADNTPTVGANEVLIRTEITSTAGGFSMLAGYNVSGTASADGIKRAVVATNANGGGGGGMGNSSVLTETANPPTGWQLPNVQKFTAGSGGANRLQNPLWYAAKYGGFSEFDDSGPGLGWPDQEDEWDRLDNDTGMPGADGLPDTFFPVHNPSKLGEQLGRALSAIVKRTGSGTAAAVVSNSANGVGLIYQALYHGQIKDESGNSVRWTGELHGFWTDSYGNLREDNGDHVLGNYVDDPVITFFIDDDNKPKFTHWTASFPDGVLTLVSDNESIPLDQLKPVWSADSLLDVPAPASSAASFANQRAYTDPVTSSSNKRYIFTWIDKNHDGIVDTGEQTDFVWSTSAGEGFYGVADTDNVVTGNFTYLNSTDPDEAEDIVNWTRGAKVDGLRNREITGIDQSTGTSVLKLMRLGDIVNSTPAVVATPAEGFDLLYNDESYATFRDTYRNRRQVVYVGANDGMLHAFNGGFYDTSTQTLSPTPPTGASVGPNAAVGHDIGAEIWAYVPGNLLPHLRWVSDRDYSHVYYVDGSAIAFDAKIFTADAVHPGGWGTVLVAPFRLGGGSISVTTPEDPGSGSCDLDVPASDDCTEEVSKSAYVLMDVTDPESEPVVIAELTTDSFTTSVPAIAIERDPLTSAPSKFFLFIASGPTDNGGLGKRAGSNKNLEIMAYDLATLVPDGDNNTDPVRTFTVNCQAAPTSAQGCFAGDLLASDYDLDNHAEAIYFGSVVDTGNPDFEGGLWKIDLDESSSVSTWSAPQLMHDAGRPVTVRPTIGRNALNQPMVFFGTGRMFSKADLTTTGAQRIYGLVDTSFLTGATVPALPLGDGNLLNATGIDVSTDSTVSGAGAGIDTFTELLQSFDDGDQYGWYLDLEAGTGPAERVVSFQTLLGGILLTTAYTPGTDICTDLGSGRLFGLNYRTGTGDPGVDFFDPEDGTTVVETSMDLGAGLPAPPSLHVGSQGGDPASSDRRVRACIQTSSGAIICKDIVTLQSVRSGEISWREPVN